MWEILVDWRFSITCKANEFIVLLHDSTIIYTNISADSRYHLQLTIRTSTIVF
jgi:hypothetical protein